MPLERIVVNRDRRLAVEQHGSLASQARIYSCEIGHQNPP
jgi:hypothetical protein